MKCIKYSPAPEYLTKLEEAIREAHGSRARHEETWMGVDQGDGHLWSGSVEIFRLIEPGPARRAFAWSKVEGSGLHCYVVLEQPGIDTPQAAIRHALVLNGEEEQVAMAS